MTRTYLGLIGIASAAIAGIVYAAWANADVSDPADSIGAAFPQTEFDEIDCDGFGPLCQVVAGQTVFYVDEQARHAFIGRLYDLEAKADLTARTLAGISPSVAAEPIYQPTSGLSWDDLPLDAAIVRHPGAARKVAVFSDLNCGYCARLNAELASAEDIEIHEFLIGQIGSAEASRAIGCAPDPLAAMDAYYQNRAVPQVSCERDIVGPAQAAATRFGAHGTPTFVRSDGETLSGFQDASSLRAWIDAVSVSTTQGDPR